jgi:hypothetical protein
VEGWWSRRVVVLGTHRSLCLLRVLAFAVSYDLVSWWVTKIGCFAFV